MIELEFLNKKHKFIAGADEVGRGPLAGPVVAASVVYKDSLKKFDKFSNALREIGVTDSKKLSDKRRREILSLLEIDPSKFKSKKSLKFNIFGTQVEVCISEKSHEYVDEFNILKSSLHAMAEAFNSFKLKDSLVLFDGNKIIKIENNDVVALVKGDSKSVLIGLASIVAKIYRDDLMNAYSKIYPQYGFEKNAGYPTKKHKESITLYGISPIHRKTFKGVCEFVGIKK